MRRVDACESKIEIVTPYWASNSAGKIRAIVNTQHFEQAIHQEVCTYVYFQSLPTQKGHIMIQSMSVTILSNSYSMFLFTEKCKRVVVAAIAVANRNTNGIAFLRTIRIMTVKAFLWIGFCFHLAVFVAAIQIEKKKSAIDYE